MLLHYYSSREGVAPYAMALVQSLAKHIWQVSMELEHYAKKGDNTDHDIFLLTLEAKYECDCISLVGVVQRDQGFYGHRGSVHFRTVLTALYDTREAKMKSN